MADFLLELLSEEIPARMQRRAAEDLRQAFGEALSAAGVEAERIEVFATPRRLALIARGLPTATPDVQEERRGPRADAPEAAIAGFLKSTGLSRAELEERDDPKGKFLYAVIAKAGRPLGEVLAEAVPGIVRTFPWPKSMRWGERSRAEGALRWVRPLQSIVALLDGEVVPVEVDGIKAGRTTRGHRFMSEGPVEIADADAYAKTLRAAHVIVDPVERAAIIADHARKLAAGAGLELIEDEGLLAENAGLTEWPVPLLGDFDPAFLEVPPEVIQLTMRTNQKYFACRDPKTGKLAPNFICVANIKASDGGAAIVAGNKKVLAARLSDARFFWETDKKTKLADHLPKLSQIVFHEKLGTVADKVERVAKLARHLAQFIPGCDADLAEQAARLAKADLVTGMVGEFPELQGIMGGYYARAEGLPDAVADAIRDHYKPVGQDDKVPSAPITLAVALADKIDSISLFFSENIRPTGSKDPFALRRSVLSVIRIILNSNIRLSITLCFVKSIVYFNVRKHIYQKDQEDKLIKYFLSKYEKKYNQYIIEEINNFDNIDEFSKDLSTNMPSYVNEIMEFFADRFKIQQREAGVRHDLIDAVFALGGASDLVLLLARVKALQAFVGTEDGTNLLAGYKRAANILRIEEKKDGRAYDGDPNRELMTLPEEIELARAVESARAEAGLAVEQEDFAAAMAALARLRPAVDAFFDHVTVNDGDARVRENRLNLLNRIRETVHTVADFSKIEG